MRGRLNFDNSMMVWILEHGFGFTAWVTLNKSLFAFWSFKIAIKKDIHLMDMSLEKWFLDKRVVLWSLDERWYVKCKAALFWARFF